MDIEQKKQDVAPHRHPVIVLLDEFIKETGLSKTYVGQLVQNETGFYDRINGGGRCWPETQDKISQILADERAKRRLIKKQNMINGPNGNHRPKSLKNSAVETPSTPDKDRVHGE